MCGGIQLSFLSCEIGWLMNSIRIHSFPMPCREGTCEERATRPEYEARFFGE